MTDGVEKKRFVAANGDEMIHCGRKAVKPKRTQDRQEKIMALSFEVKDVTKPLASVRRVAERGNAVCLHPEGSSIENTTSKERMPLRKKGGSCVMDVDLMVDTSVFGGQV